MTYYTNQTHVERCPNSCHTSKFTFDLRVLICSFFYILIIILSFSLFSLSLSSSPLSFSILPLSFLLLSSLFFPSLHLFPSLLSLLSLSPFSLLSLLSREEPRTVLLCEEVADLVAGLDQLIQNTGPRAVHERNTSQLTARIRETLTQYTRDTRDTQPVRLTIHNGYI